MRMSNFFILDDQYIISKAGTGLELVDLTKNKSVLLLSEAEKVCIGISSQNKWNLLKSGLKEWWLKMNLRDILVLQLVLFLCVSFFVCFKINMVTLTLRKHCSLD